MQILLFGATGMIGQGVLRECLLDPNVRRVVAVGRNPTGQRHEKLEDLVVSDLTNLYPQSAKLEGFDACFYSLGVSSVGMSEDDYRRVTYDLTLAVARVVLPLNPDLTFIYVSGQGTDAAARGKSMWARVKGRTENALLEMSKKSYMFRPGAIIPLHGIRSRTGWYNAFYAVTKPLYPLLKRIFPKSLLTTEQLGRAMIAVGKRGTAKHVLETPDIVALASNA